MKQNIMKTKTRTDNSQVHEVNYIGAAWYPVTRTSQNIRLTYYPSKTGLTGVWRVKWKETMSTTVMTPELETVNEDYTEGTVLFTNPFNDDYARVNITWDSVEFDPIWSSNFDVQAIKELELMAEKFFNTVAEEYTPVNTEPVDPYEFFGVSPKDFY